MALHSNDQTQLSHVDGFVSDKSLLKNSNTLFHNVDISSHIPAYSMNSYGHNAEMLLKNLSHCASRPDFSISSNYHSINHDIPTEEGNPGSSDQSFDFGHRSGIYNPGQCSYSPDTSGHDLYSEHSQSSTGNVVRTRRRKACGVEETRVCVVCGEPASGYNFDRLTCESCKAFFRRNALKSKERIKACGRNGDCNIEGVQRKHCPSCRLEKCLAVGMKKELILPPEKLEQRAKPKRRKQHVNSDGSEGGGGGGGGGGGQLSFSHPNSTANLFSTPPPTASSGLLHHRAAQHQTSVSSAITTHYDGDAAHEFMASRTLNTLFTDITGPRNAPGQLMGFGGLSDPRAVAAAVKFQLAMTSNTANAVNDALSSGLNPGVSNASSPFTSNFATTHQRLPHPPPSLPGQFSSEGSFPSDGDTTATPSTFHDGRPCQTNWYQPTVQASMASDTITKLLNTPQPTTEPSGFLRRRRCRLRNFTALCYHSTCRRTFLRQHRHLLQSDNHNNPGSLPLELERPDKHLFSCLTECVQRTREPFSPEEALDTQATESLEQEYNRMDACIRRIIRVVKMLPYFNEIGKPAQLGLLRANIYGMIVLYSSFFFDRDIRKLRYPIKHLDGSLSTVNVSMLDDLTTSIGDGGKLSSGAFASKSGLAIAASLREDFELYKSNTLAAFNHLDELAGEDDILRMTLLAIKLFSDDSLSEDLRALVVASKHAYLVFLWTYIRWRAGPKHLRDATELFARLHLAFIDLRSLEIRMTEFAKLVSLDSLSPLMREICSFRSGSVKGSVSGQG